MVIEDLKEQCQAVYQAEQTLNTLREQRDSAMYELKAAGVPERSLVKYTGLSLSSVQKITTGARRSPEALDLETSRRATQVIPSSALRPSTASLFALTEHSARTGVSRL